MENDFLQNLLTITLDIFGKRNRAFFHKHDILGLLGLR